jgi:glycosyltransferase involved in cell wall biosynthesis
MTYPLISVIIPNHNYGQYLRQAIDSALGQSYPRVEVIVVDDGSTDDSLAILRSYGDRIRCVQQQNQGVSAARNRGIQESQGELVAFLDADDFWHPEKLARQVELLKNLAVGMVYCGVHYVDSSGQRVGTALSGGPGHFLRDLVLFRTAIGFGSSSLVRKECFDRVGLFNVDLSTSADWDMCRRIACHYDVDVVREPLVLYRLHTSAMHRNVNLFEHDVLRAFADMFGDPTSAKVLPPRRRCYGRVYLVLSGSYLYDRQWDKCLKYAVRSVVTWPPSLIYLALFPIRHVRRRALARSDQSRPIV